MTRTVRTACVALTLALMLAACMVLPGRFTSDLTVHREGTFAFRYAGEIVLMPLADPGTAGKTAADEQDDVFSAEPCTDPQSGDAHDCSAQELARQKQDWARRQAERKTSRTQSEANGRKAMAALLGGLDPGDPRAAQEFAARLSRQQGWTQVTARGNGRFDVVFETTGRLDHDFTFPVIERVPMVVPFVTVIRRKDGTVRVDAPAFSPSAANPQLPGLADVPGGKSPPAVLDGTFTVHSDGQVLANNTDEGPQADGAAKGSRLQWRVNARTGAAPTALLRLTP